MGETIQIQPDTFNGASSVRARKSGNLDARFNFEV